MPHDRGKKSFSRLSNCVTYLYSLSGMNFAYTMAKYAFVVLTGRSTVVTRTRTYQIWCLGLDSEEVDSIRACAGVNHQIVVLPEDDLPALEDIEREDPVLLWLGRDCWRRFLAQRSVETADAEGYFPGMSAGRFLEYVPQVLVLPDACSREDLELALDGGFQDVVRGVLSANRIHEVLCRSLEVSNIHRDMDRMTREILLNRELLTRKSDVLSFLLHFMREIAPGSDKTMLLEDVRHCLAELLPLEAMHGVFWRQEADGLLHVELRMELPEALPMASGGTAFFQDGSAQQDAIVQDEAACADMRQFWTDVLLETVGSLSPVPVSRYRVTNCSLPVSAESGARAEGVLLPDPARLIILPLGAGEHVVGALALLLTEECPLGRDQALALDAAMRHLVGVLSSMSLYTSGMFACAEHSMSQMA